MRATLLASLTPRTTSYVPHDPTPAQAAFLLLDDLEAFYGGAVGGGKSDALLMAALQYVDVPRYKAILFRRSYTDLSLPGALIPRAREWLIGTDARYDLPAHTWVFPSGATLTFGYLQRSGDEERYRSADFAFIGFDELTQFSEHQYRFLFSRLRKDADLGRERGIRVPLRVRSASNPGGPGHDWVMSRFIDQKGEHRPVFVRARLDDNPYLDREAYLASLSQLDDVTRAQLLDGNWKVKPVGGRFRAEWAKFDTDLPTDAQSWPWVRYWDLAATEPKPGADPDHVAGVLMGRSPDNRIWIADVARTRGTPGDVEAFLEATTTADAMFSDNVTYLIEKEPGSAGEFVEDTFSRGVFLGRAFRGVRSTGKKEVRALPFSTFLQRGNVTILLRDWTSDYLSELEAFPLGAHDDQVDASSGAFLELTANAYTPGSGSIDATRSAWSSSGVASNPYHANRNTHRSLTRG